MVDHKAESLQHLINAQLALRAAAPYIREHHPELDVNRILAMECILGIVLAAAGPDAHMRATIAGYLPFTVNDDRPAIPVSLLKRAQAVIS